MKAENLVILRENGINVPDFTVLRNDDCSGLELKSSGSYAVRSSCDLEDGCEMSYAGQFDSFLNVNPEDVPEKVRQVIKSAEKINVSDYQKAGKCIRKPEMSVIVQDMIDSEISGIMFSANPSGILNEAVIVAGYGLGDSIVEDRADTTSYYFNTDDELYYYEQNGDSPLLDDDILKKLIENCLRIREIFGMEMDIEYAVKDSEVFILQARPITTLDTDSPVILDNSNIVESYPGICAPLTQEFVKDIYYRIFKSLILRITKDKKLTEEMDPDLRNMTAIANGRAYYQISNWYQVLRLLPMSRKIIPLWQDMLGVRQKTVSAPERKTSISAKISLVFSLVKCLIRTPAQMDELNAFFREYISGFDIKLTSREKEKGELFEKVRNYLSLYYEIFESIVCRWDITLINDMYAFIYTGLSGKKNRKYIADIGNLESMKPVRETEKLTETAHIYGMDSSEYLEARERYIEIYGDRCLNELKLETKTYRTDPEILDSYIKKRLETFRENISSEKDNVSESHRDSFFIRRAKKGIYNREISRMNRTRLFGIARRIFLDIGEELRNAGYIDCREDIFWFRISEIKAAAETCDFSGLRLLKEDAVRRYEMQKNIPAYGRIVFSGEVTDKVIHDACIKFSASGNELTGVASSAGKVTGKVVVIDSPDITTDTENRIIVTRMTDPGWVFLIENSLGIIAEKGSVLSHTAIITRELGKPSVVNVKDATKILRTGDIAEMDAYSGIIRILSRAEEL